jgi:hypothetical protein
MLPHITPQGYLGPARAGSNVVLLQQHCYKEIAPMCRFVTHWGWIL